MFNCRNPGHHAWLVGFRFNVSATIPSGTAGLRRAPPDEFHFEDFRCKKGSKSFSSPPKTSAAETGQMSSVETGQMSAVETAQMSAAQTGQMSAAETGQMSSAETRQISTGKTGRCPVLLFCSCLVSERDSRLV